MREHFEALLILNHETLSLVWLAAGGITIISAAAFFRQREFNGPVAAYGAAVAFAISIFAAIVLWNELVNQAHSKDNPLDHPVVMLCRTTQVVCFNFGGLLMVICAGLNLRRR